MIGMTEDEARDAIGDAGLSVDAPDFKPDEEAENGEVIDQDPNRDQYVDPGTSIHLTISSGLPMVDVPSLVGSTQQEARDRLRTAKLRPQFESQESDLPQGQVLATNPEAGQPVEQDSVVTVTISKGPDQVPSVIGLNRSDAIKQIVDAGFQYDIRGDGESTEPRGTVTDQLPPGGQPQPQGTTITLFVSTYEPPPPPPTETPTIPPTPTETPTVGTTPRTTSDRPPTATVRGVCRLRGRGDRRRVGQVQQTVVRRRGDLVGDVEVPADGDLRVVGLLAVDLQVVVVGDRAGEVTDVTDRLDDVGLRVGHALDHDRVALALDAGGAHHALALEDHRLGAALPHRVDHGLDVLLVHDQQVLVAGGRVDHLVGRVGEGDHHAGTRARGEAGRALERLDLLLVAAYGVVVDLVGEVADLLGQLGHPRLEIGGAVGLGVGEGGQVVVPPRPQVGALAGLRADHEAVLRRPAPPPPCPAASASGTSVPVRAAGPR